MKNKTYEENLGYYRSKCWVKNAPKRNILLDDVARKFYGYTYAYYVFRIEMIHCVESGKPMKELSYKRPRNAWFKRKMRERCNRNLT